MEILNEESFDVSKAEEAPEDVKMIKHSARFYFALSAILLCVFVVALDQVITGSALAAITRDLKASSNNAYWVGTSYLLAQTVSQPIYGSLSDVFGRKWMLQLSLVVFLVSSITCSRAQTIEWLIGARVAQGIGGGGLTTLPPIVISDMTTVRERARCLTYMAISFAFGNFGVVIGAAIGERTTWRWVFYINIPICVVAIVCIQLFLHLSLDTGSFLSKFWKLDWIGIFTFSASLSSLLVGIAAGGTSRPWSSAAVIVPIVLGVCGLIGFVCIEKWVATLPILTLEVFQNNTAKIAMIDAFAVGFALGVATYYLIVYFLGATGRTLINSAVDVLPTILLVPSAATVAGAIIAKSKDFRMTLCLGLTLIAIGGGSLVSLTSSSGLGHQVGLQLILGAGIGLVYSSYPIAAQAGQPDHLHGVAINLVTFFRTLGQTFGIAISATIFQDEFDRHINTYIANGKINQAVLIRGQDAEGAFSLIETFPADIVTIYRQVYSDSLHNVWYTLMAVGIFALLMSLLAQRGNLNRGFTTKQRFREH